MCHKVLIITTFFPPDTAISAVRPYMFAKYLTKLGYDVTVCRSGEINAFTDSDLQNSIDGMRVFSYLGADSPAEKFKRGETIELSRGKSRVSFLPKKLQKLAGKLYHFVFSYKEFQDQMEIAEDKFEKQKDFLQKLKESGASFDVVFSTYGEMENVYAGKYAAELFHCKYILDYRDLMATHTFNSRREYKVLSKIQCESILVADVCTCVSGGMQKELSALVPERKVITLYNGHEPTDFKTFEQANKNSNEFSFCYTGQLYSGLRDASQLFHAISDNCKEGKMNKEKICFYYAGRDFQTLYEQAKVYDMESVLENKGYLGKEDVMRLQTETDIFTVLSWNTRKAHGILTGKFYEGIRCKRPILTIISGNEADSELKEMNNKYHYGFCYESANHTQDFVLLKKWLESQYQKKMSGKMLKSTATQSFFMDFRYDTISEQLNQIIETLVNGVRENAN